MMIRTLIIAHCAFLASLGTTQAAPITYALTAPLIDHSSNPGDGIPLPFIVTGSVTTDGTLGGLQLSNILSWQWNATNVGAGGSLTYFADSTVGSISQMSGIVATSTSLGVTAPNSILLQSDIQPWGLKFTLVQAHALADVRPTLPASNGYYSDTLNIDNVFVFATVPEPSTMLMALIGAICLGTWQRGTRQASL